MDEVKKTLESDVLKYQNLYCVTSVILAIVTSILLFVFFSNLMMKSLIDVRSEEYQEITKEAEDIFWQSQSMMSDGDSVDMISNGITYEIVSDKITFVLDEYDTRVTGSLSNEKLLFDIEPIMSIRTIIGAVFISISISLALVLVIWWVAGSNHKD